MDNMKYMKFFLIIMALIISCTNSDQKQNIHNIADYVIAYNVAVNIENDDYDIWTADPVSGVRKNITNHKDVAWTYRAAGNKILFISDRDTSKRNYYLYEMNVDGSGIRKINDFRLSDSWMDTRFDDSEIIVTPHRSVDSVFYIINRDGNLLNKISTGLPYSNDPVFSPNGNQIAFRGASKKSKREAGFDEAIYLIKADGSGLTRLTHYPEADTTAPWYAYKAGPPQWHPTENFISFQSFQNGKYSLYAVTPDGQKQWKLTNNEMQEGYHEWSPDGNWLAIELFNKDQTQFHIGLMDWQNKTMKILTDTSYVYQQAPVFVIK